MGTSREQSGGTARQLIQLSPRAATHLLTGKKGLSSFLGQKMLAHQPAHRALPWVTNTPHSNLSTAEGLSPKINPSFFSAPQVCLLALASPTEVFICP